MYTFLLDHFLSFGKGALITFVQFVLFPTSEKWVYILHHEKLYGQKYNFIYLLFKKMTLSILGT